MITIDLAGHGNSASLEVTGYVDQIEEILIAEGVKYATWIGYSMGGYIVLAAIKKFTLYKACHFIPPY